LLFEQGPTAMAKPKPPKKKPSVPRLPSRDEPKSTQGASKLAQREIEFSAGDRVVHPRFGEGKILEVHPEKLTIQFGAWGIKQVPNGFIARRR
jgi:hypothetical protein